MIHLGYSLTLQCSYQVVPLSVVYLVARRQWPDAVLVFGEMPSSLGPLCCLAVVIGIGLIATQTGCPSSVFRQPEA